MSERTTSIDTTNPRKHYYRGTVATQYDAERAAESKWRLELKIVRKILATLDPAASILDVPLGTGRFLHIYGETGRRSLFGADISMDMLLQARTKIESHAGAIRTEMMVADAEYLPLKNGSIDYVVCIRFLNWLSNAHLDKVITECRRVTRRGLIIGIRLHRELRPYDLMQLRPRHLGPALRHMIGSARQLLSRHIDGTVPAMTSIDDQENSEFKLHEMDRVLNLFATRGLKAARQYSFDIRWDDDAKRLLPYCIFLLEPRDDLD